MSPERGSLDPEPADERPKMLRSRADSQPRTERSLRIPGLVGLLDADETSTLAAEMRSIIDPHLASDLSDAQVLEVVDAIDSALRAWELSAFAVQALTTRKNRSA